VYPLRAWNDFEEQLMRLPQFDDCVRDLRRIYFGSAVECEVDSVGRLLVPPMLRDHADLRRELVWMGSGKFLELWNKDDYHAMRTNITSDAERRQAMGKRMAELGM
jgi:MraZ protein